MKRAFKTISCRGPNQLHLGNIINLNTCHAGIPKYVITAALLVFKYECHNNEKDIAKMEEHFSGAYSEFPYFIVEIGVQPNWHNEVNHRV